MPPAEPRLAAAIILRAPEGEVLLSKRSAGAPFLGGFVAFVGGRVEDTDEALARALLGRADEPARVWIAALRELLEETGLLLTEDGLEAGWDRATPLPDALGARPCPPVERGAPAGRWVTPDYAPIRFDTCFLLVDVPAAARPEPDLHELEWARFMTPRAILDAHGRLEALLPRPTKDQLQTLDDAPREAASALLDGLVTEEGHAPPPGTSTSPRGRPASPGFEPVHGIWQLPLRTPTLPPATHTNCYVVGHERAVVIDPATYDDDERAKLGRLLDALAAAGTHFEAVLLTHHHRDHVGSARWAADRLGVPIEAHPVTRELLAGEVEVDALLDDGDHVELGHDATGAPFRLRCLHTPGHAAGHLVFADERRGAGGLIVGDMVAAVGTIIVDPDEGDMAEYIRQLERLAALDPGVVYPAHGPPVAHGRAKLEAYVAHRLAREARVVAALKARGAPSSAEELLELAYADTPRAVWPLAARSCLAHLHKLVADGRAEAPEPGRFALVAAGA